MMMKEAMAIINKEQKPSGYMVSFERMRSRFLVSDYFPANGDPLIPTEEEAWELAKKFAEETVGRCINIYVVDNGFMPVKGYREREIKNRISSSNN